MVAAGALLVDYVLTVAVSVAAGVAAITSAFPAIPAGWIVPISALCIVLVTLVNLRGVRDSGNVFAVPTYLFLGSMLLLIGVGLLRALLGDAPDGDARHRRSSPAPRRSGVLLLMRAFADGCSAITGVEAVSNGVPAFRTPEWRNARTTLTVMAVLVGDPVPRHEHPRARRRRPARPARDDPQPAGPGDVRHRADVLRPPAVDDGHPRPRREHRLRRLPAARRRCSPGTG